VTDLLFDAFGRKIKLKINACTGLIWVWEKLRRMKKIKEGKGGSKLVL